MMAKKASIFEVSNRVQPRSENSGYARKKGIYKMLMSSFDTRHLFSQTDIRDFVLGQSHFFLPYFFR